MQGVSTLMLMILLSPTLVAGCSAVGEDSSSSRKRLELKLVAPDRIVPGLHGVIRAEVINKTDYAVSVPIRGAYTLVVFEGTRPLRCFRIADARAHEPVASKPVSPSGNQAFEFKATVEPISSGEVNLAIVYPDGLRCEYKGLRPGTYSVQFRIRNEASSTTFPNMWRGHLESAHVDLSLN